MWGRLRHDGLYQSTPEGTRPPRWQRTMLVTGCSALDQEGRRPSPPPATTARDERNAQKVGEGARYKRHAANPGRCRSNWRARRSYLGRGYRSHGSLPTQSGWLPQRWRTSCRTPHPFPPSLVVRTSLHPPHTPQAQAPLLSPPASVQVVRPHAQQKRRGVGQAAVHGLPSQTLHGHRRHSAFLLRCYRRRRSSHTRLAQESCRLPPFRKASLAAVAWVFQRSAPDPPAHADGDDGSATIAPPPQTTRRRKPWKRRKTKTRRK